MEPLKKVRLNIDCSTDERRLIRVLAANEDKSISQFILGLVRREIVIAGIGNEKNSSTVKQKHSNTATPHLIIK